jgi:predicted nucleotidyltransferase
MKLKKITPPKITQKMISEIVSKIVDNFNPEKIILFGSFVWGKPKEWSDIDILVIMKYSGSSPKVAAKISNLAKPKLVPMDILVRTPKEIEKRVKLGDYFIKRILNGGKVLYDKAAS